MTQRPKQDSPDFDEVLAQAQASQSHLADLIPSLYRSAGLSPTAAAEVLVRAERHPQKSRLVRDARRTLDRLIPATASCVRPGGLACLPGLKA